MSLALAPEFSARVRRDEPLSRHTSWHVGGPAEVFFNPRDVADLAAFLRAAAGGRADPLDRARQQPAGARRRPARASSSAPTARSTRSSAATQTSVRAEAGVACARIARQCIKWGLGPAEFFAGIPGTLGGALAMNAGAFGGETWQHVRSVETIDRAAATHRRAPQEYRVSYRQVIAPGARRSGSSPRSSNFEHRPGAHAGEVRALLERRRKASQPIGEWSCGSVFTNPPGITPRASSRPRASRAFASATPRCRRSTRTSSSITAMRAPQDLERSSSTCATPCSACTASR